MLGGVIGAASSVTSAFVSATTAGDKAEFTTRIESPSSSAMANRSALKQEQGILALRLSHHGQDEAVMVVGRILKAKLHKKVREAIAIQPSH
jgi:hypothetical protein